MPVQVLESERKLFPAIMRGLACRCPNCGKGTIFRAFLKTNDTCPACGEELFHHRADDLPPYIGILVVGHVIVGLMLHLEMAWHIPPMTYLMWLIPVAILLPIAILQPTKGAVIGLQWAARMHGFGGEDASDPAFVNDEPPA